MPNRFKVKTTCRRFYRNALAVLWISLFSASVYADVFVGLVYPKHEITLSAGVGGLLTKQLVGLGERVTMGKPLLQLDERLQAIETERRRVILEDKSELSSTRDKTRILEMMLNDSKAVYAATASISKEELLRLESEYLSSAGRLEQLIAEKRREQLDYEFAKREQIQRSITAPVNGIITRVLLKPGEWAKPGDPLLILVDASTVILQVAVPHGIVNHLKLGSSREVEFEIGSLTPRATGRITFISPVADPTSGLVEVEITIGNSAGNIRPGVKGTINILDTEKLR
ncbi:MAG: efflux RND transporter periplasmic adaptor subunit [Burkholderiales bacterium]|nr:efflux RND transporter periplasmic adaptor subunit [Burkholderiales bacterium]